MLNIGYLVMLVVLLAVAFVCRPSSSYKFQLQKVNVPEGRTSVYPGDLFEPPIHTTVFRDFYNTWSSRKFAEQEAYWFLEWSSLIKAIPAGHPWVDGVVMVGGPDAFTQAALTGAVINVDPGGVGPPEVIDGDTWSFNRSVSAEWLVHTIQRHPRFKTTFDLLKLDFDGYECDILEAVLHAGFRPKVLVMELNSIWVPPLRFSLRQDPNWHHGFGHPWMYGCSLQYASDVMAKYGYALVQYACWDGWYVRSDLLAGTKLAPMASVSVREHYTLGNPHNWAGIGADKYRPYIQEWLALGQASADPRLMVERVLANISASGGLGQFPFLLSYA